MSTSSHPFLEFPQIKPPSLLMMGKTLNSIEIAPSCPRCFSSNNKFCYYNNYSVSQPRYFCKSCRRYWTKGGSLRNVPIGGGCRKSRRARRESPPPSEIKNADVAAASSGVNKDYEECGESVDAIDGGDEGLRHVHGSFDGGDFVYENFDVGSEMMWSDLEGFGREQPPPLMEIQGFEVFSSDDDRLRMSDENFISENWGSFDLDNF